VETIPFDVDACLEELLWLEYRKSWVVIDGVEQHPQGLSFIEWLRKMGLLKQGK
jgi:hypothetical protein